MVVKESPGGREWGGGSGENWTFGEPGALVKEGDWELGCLCLRGSPLSVGLAAASPSPTTTQLYREQERDKATLAGSWARPTEVCSLFPVYGKRTDPEHTDFHKKMPRICI